MPKVDMNPTPPQPIQPPPQTQEALHVSFYLNHKEFFYPPCLLAPQKTREDQEYYQSIVIYAQYLKTPEGRREAEINEMREDRRLHPLSFGRRAFNVALQVVSVFIWVMIIKRELKGSRFFQ